MSKHFELLKRVANADLFRLPDESAPPMRTAATGLVFKKPPTDAEITKLVQRLFSPADKGDEPRMVSFSGITREDRSSWICARAGEALVEQSDASICLVEANFFSPQLHVHLSTANPIGLAEALTAKAPIRNFAMPLASENLYLIPSGSVKPGFCVSVERYRERFAELREAFDYVLISAPPIRCEVEAGLIGRLADGVVLVVEANHNRRDTVRRAKEQMESAQVRLLGAVLDQRTFPIPEGLYRRL